MQQQQAKRAADRRSQYVVKLSVRRRALLSEYTNCLSVDEVLPNCLVSMI